SGSETGHRAPAPFLGARYPLGGTIGVPRSRHRAGTAAPVRNDRPNRTESTFFKEPVQVARPRRVFATANPRSTARLAERASTSRLLTLPEPPVGRDGLSRRGGPACRRRSSSSSAPGWP